MKRFFTLTGTMMLAIAGPLAAQDAVRIAGAACEEPPPLHCPDGSCTGQAMVTEGGPVIEAETGRNYFLDYPCDLRAGEEVTFILNLHGGGSYGNWQRHYFPIFDYVKEHRLVVATPYSPRRMWTTDDDVYLQNIVEFVTDQIGAENIRAFWLAGHSQGGMTSRRLICTDFYRDRVDGFVSLSGGRIGTQAAVSLGAPRPSTNAAPTGGAARGASAASGDRPAAMSAPAELDCDFSHIYTTGEHELREGLASLPTISTHAERYGCSDRVRQPDIVDTEPGYVHDSTRQNPPTLSWGRLPGPGTAQVFAFPACNDGRVVADIVRIDKGHTEGLEPNVTRAIVEMMVSARGGKLQGRE